MAGNLSLVLLLLLLLPATSHATPIRMEELVATVETPSGYRGARPEGPAGDDVAQVWNDIREAASGYIVASSAVVTSIPEPGTVSLLVLGIAALGARRARRQPLR